MKKITAELLKKNDWAVSLYPKGCAFEGIISSFTKRVKEEEDGWYWDAVYSWIGKSLVISRGLSRNERANKHNCDVYIGCCDTIDKLNTAFEWAFLDYKLKIE